MLFAFLNFDWISARVKIKIKGRNFEDIYFPLNKRVYATRSKHFKQNAK